MSPQNREAAERAMQQIGNQDEQKPQRDHKAWAWKILNSPKGRSPAVIRMAQAAVGEAA
ncbi:hypothetical protein [Alcaligenes sp. Marseille-Q7550]